MKKLCLVISFLFLNVLVWGQEKTAFTIERDSSATTQVSFYFTDGKGTFYKSKTDIEILDTSNHKVW
jgi:hypothetical protein